MKAATILHCSLLALASAVAAPLPAAAQGAHASSAIELNRQAEKLKPGEWAWAPGIAPAGPVTVYVDLSKQVATVYRNGVRIGVSTVSTGKPGHETPTGVFTILQKDIHHRSSTYNNAPMPYQERLTWDGVALHAGGLPGYPESHGCVHLPMEFSRLLFGTTQLGGTVIIAGEAGTPVIAPGGGVIAAAGTSHARAPLAPREDYRWNPAAAPDGPMTIVVSRSDRRAIVLRNGVEIGRARIDLPTEDFETHVLTAIAAPGGDLRWLYVAVPGHEGDKGRPFDMSIMARVKMPPAFHDAVLAAIKPGTTILLTQAPVLTHNSGRSLAVLASARSEPAEQ